MMTSLAERLELARLLLPVARAAGALELSYYQSGTEVMDKVDGSPVTRADQEAEALISQSLADIAPGIPMVGEEATAAGHVPDLSGGRFFLVDPLDGTKDFISGTGDFTVNIALVEEGRPVLGVIYAPVSDTMWYGACRGLGEAGEAFVQKSADGAARGMTVRPVPAEGLTVMASKRHGNPEALAEALAPYKVKTLSNRSSSLKFCAVAMGEADLYLRLGPTSEWDIAAGEAIVHAAGGFVTDLSGQKMVYGKFSEKLLNPPFVVRGQPEEMQRAA